MQSLRSFIVLYSVIASAVNVLGDCDVVPMVQWAGEECLRKDILESPVGMVVIQHTATAESGDGDCDNIVKAIRRFHMDTLKFDDIGQSFFVCPNGTVYEGAGWERVGAHTRGYNRKSIAISFIGQFDTKLPTHKALNAAMQLLECGVSHDHLSRDYKLVGHRQVSGTLSPGAELQKELQNWPHWYNIQRQ